MSVGRILTLGLGTPFSSVKYLVTLGLGTTAIPPIVVIDTHDGGEEDRRKFRQRKEQLQQDLVAAYNRTFGISVPEETEPAEMVAAIEENLPQIATHDFAEAEKRIIEKLVVKYREYEEELTRYRLAEEIDEENEIISIAAMTLLH